jgi:hypothetical protein
VVRGGRTGVVGQAKKTAGRRPGERPVSGTDPPGVRGGPPAPIISFITAAQSEVIRRILEHLGVSTVVPRAHGPPEWLARHEQEERAVRSREEDDFSQAPAELDEWEPA